MKNLLIIFAMLFLPLSVSAKTPLSDVELSNICGQAGVSINPDLTMDINIGTIAWGDSDGINPANGANPWPAVPEGGYVGINNFNIRNLKISLRTDPSDNYNSYSTLFLKPITIDVATGTKLGIPGTTFVRIGTGALKISMDQMQFDVALGPYVDTGTGKTPVLNQIFGVVTLAPMEVYVNTTSYVDVYSHANHGVTFDVNVTLDHIYIPYMSWGDRDGLTSGNGNYMTNTGAGYIGLYDFRIGSSASPAMITRGSMQIDVLTTKNGI